MMAKQDTPTQKNFRDHLIQVLGERTHFQPYVPVHHKDVYAEVCTRAGYDEDQFGVAKGTKTLQTHRWISFAFRDAKKVGVTCAAKNKEGGDCRGRWCLTEAGVAEAKALAGVQEDTTVAPVENEDIIAQVAKQMDEAVTGAPPTSASPVAAPANNNVVRLPTRPVPYTSDPYLRALAIEQTPCFGAYSSRSKECEGCHLSTDCILNQRAVKSQLASELRKQKSTPKKAPKKPPANKPSEDSIEELIGQTIGSDGEDHSAEVGRLKKNGWKLIPIVADTGCATCNKTISKGEHAYWKQGAGVHHQECALDPSFDG